MEKTKITMKIHPSVLNQFEKKLRASFLKRDDFLNHILSIELAYLREDLVGRCMSKSASLHVSKSLIALPEGSTILKQISVVVDKSIAATLKEIVKEHNLCRDAFFNRLMLLLIGSQRLLKMLKLPTSIHRLNYGHASVSDVDVPLPPLQAIQSILEDPLFYIREACRKNLSTGLYLVNLPAVGDSFSCFVDDDDLPYQKGINAVEATKFRE